MADHASNGKGSAVAQDPLTMAAQAAAAAAISAAGAVQMARAASVAAGGTGELNQELRSQTAPPRKLELLCGGAVMALWFSVFVVGYVVPTHSMRDALLNKPHLWGGADAAAASFPSLLGMLAVIGVAFTLSNIFCLCLCASFLGCMGRRWSTPFDYKKSRGAPGTEDEERLDVREIRRAYTTALLRGFLIYLMTLAGYLLVIPENAIKSIQQEQYARLAGTLSALAFVVGFRPESIPRLLESVLGNKTVSSGSTSNVDVARSDADIRIRREVFSAETKSVDQVANPDVKKTEGEPKAQATS